MADKDPETGERYTRFEPPIDWTYDGSHDYSIGGGGDPQIGWPHVSVHSPDPEEGVRVCDLICDGVNSHEKLLAALKKIAEGAPTEEPSVPESDNYDDTFANGLMCEHYRLAEVARKAIAEAERGG